jgi:hypothetical protein
MKYDSIPPYINISTMTKLLGLSRSRLYQLVEQGVLLKAVYLLNTKRPVYTREMAARNLEAKNSNVGINGEIVMFYSAKTPVISVKTKKTVRKSTERQSSSSNKYAEIVDALESLGLKDITPSLIDTSTEQCFPDGTENVTEDEIITEVFRYLKGRT